MITLVIGYSSLICSVSMKIGTSYEVPSANVDLAINRDSWRQKYWVSSSSSLSSLLDLQFRQYVIGFFDCKKLFFKAGDELPSKFQSTDHITSISIFKLKSWCFGCWELRLLLFIPLRLSTLSVVSVFHNNDHHSDSQLFL